MSIVALILMYMSNKKEYTDDLENRGRKILLYFRYSAAVGSKAVAEEERW